MRRLSLSLSLVDRLESTFVQRQAQSQRQQSIECLEDTAIAQLECQGFIILFHSARTIHFSKGWRDVLIMPSHWYYDRMLTPMGPSIGIHPRMLTSSCDLSLPNARETRHISPMCSPGDYSVRLHFWKIRLVVMSSCNQFPM